MNYSCLRSLATTVKLSSNLKTFVPKSPSSLLPLTSSFASRKAISPFHVSSSPASSVRTMASKTTDTFLELAAARRSYYALGSKLPISTDRVQEIVKESLKQVPSSFNSQSNRVVVLFGAEHEKLWDITSDVLKAIVPAEQFAGTAQKLAGFKAAAGSVLFFEDQTVVEGMQAKFAIYADRFPVWATQSVGMLQWAIWTALEAEGLGANLQHYNPLIDEKVQSTWKVPATWKLNAQLVFGSRSGEAGPKEFKPFEETYKVYGA